MLLLVGAVLGLVVYAALRLFGADSWYGDVAYQAEFRSYPEADNISLIVFRWISDEVEVQDTPVEEPDELLETLEAIDAAMGRLKQSKL